MTGGVNIGKVGLKRREGLANTAKEKQWKTIVEGFMKLCKQAGASLNAGAKEEIHVRFVGDVTSKASPWPAVYRAREEELIYQILVRMNEQTSIANYGVSSIDTVKFSVEKPLQVRP